MPQDVRNIFIIGVSERGEFSITWEYLETKVLNVLYVATKFIFLRMAGIQAKISIVGSIVKIDTA
jgi:hypothetical protein